MRAIGIRAMASGAILAAALAWPAVGNAAPRNTTISSSLEPADGAYTSPLTTDPAGNLYGTKIDGGLGERCFDRGCGSVFDLAVPTAPGGPWRHQTLFRFINATTGGRPCCGALLRDSLGNLFGTASQGGAGSAQIGLGTVWELSPPAGPGGVWRFQLLHVFGGPDGGTPGLGLVMDRTGTLYGTAATGGSLNGGVVFALAPPAAGGSSWTETILHDFGAPGDAVADGLPLTMSKDQDVLYGAAAQSLLDGKYTGGGLVFRLRRAAGGWSYRVLHRFAPTTVKRSPVGSQPGGGLLIDGNGNLFGVTQRDGAGHAGVLYELSPPAAGQTRWTETVLHAFGATDPSDAQCPVGTLVAAGTTPALFGTTSAGGEGGAADGSKGIGGVTYRLDPPASGSGPWTFTALHAFSQAGTCGALSPLNAGLALGPHRRLFGTTLDAGKAGASTVFSQTRD